MKSILRCICLVLLPLLWSGTAQAEWQIESEKTDDVPVSSNPLDTLNRGFGDQ